MGRPQSSVGTTWPAYNLRVRATAIRSGELNFENVGRAAAGGGMALASLAWRLTRFTRYVSRPRRARGQVAPFTTRGCWRPTPKITLTTGGGLTHQPADAQRGGTRLSRHSHRLTTSPASATSTSRGSRNPELGAADRRKLSADGEDGAPSRSGRKARIGVSGPLRTQLKADCVLSGQELNAANFESVFNLAQ